VPEALQRLGMKNVVLLSPYKSNKNVIDYLNASGKARVKGRGSLRSSPMPSR
jgi:maleate cis-trans isomerase